MNRLKRIVINTPIGFLLQNCQVFPWIFRPIDHPGVQPRRIIAYFTLEKIDRVGLYYINYRYGLQLMLRPSDC